MQIIIEKTLTHNIKDRSLYASEEDALKRFFNENGIRKIGIIDNNKEYFLVKTEDGKHPVSLVGDAECPSEKKIMLYELSQKWITNWYMLFNDKRQEEIEQMLLKAESPVSRRQEKINFKREIQKQMKQIRKAFISQRMEGYDFREVDISDSIFINCHLNGSNFSNVNMQNAILINCEIDNCIFYNTFMNNALVYDNCEVVSLKEKITEEVL